RAEPVLRDRAGLLVFLDRADDGADRRLRPRRHPGARRPAAAMSLELPMAPQAPALETRGLCKSFGALTVADAIDFRLERGGRRAGITGSSRRPSRFSKASALPTTRCARSTPWPTAASG